MSVRDRSPLRRNINIEAENMAEISQVEMSMAKEMLPEYSGGSKNLAYFIRQVDYYISLLRRPDEHCLFNKLLFEQVKSKLVGEARDVLITSNCTNWSQIKEALLHRFGDPRSEELLVNDLATCYQKNNETYETYFERIKHKLQVLLEHVTIRTPNNDIRISKENMYTSQALSVFKSGILEPYCSHLLNLPIATLEQALFECRRYDNNKSQISFMNFMRNKSKPGNNSNNISKSNFRQMTNVRSYPQLHPSHFYPHNNFAYNNSLVPQSYSNNTPHSSQNPQTSQFPRGPINITSHQQKAPVNSQAIVKREQKFTPTPMSTTTKNSFTRQRPTPMSVSTRNNFRPNYFQSQSRPTFISEELFNVEHPSDDNPYPECSYDTNTEDCAEISDEAANFQIPASEPESAE